MSTAPDMLKQFGGQPVGTNNRFEGWWGGDVYFADFDNGKASDTGKNDMNHPAKDIQRSIDNAGTDATIYVRPRAFASGTYGEDAQQITPAAADAENFHIDKAKDHLSIIGTGKGLGHASAGKAWLGGYSGLVTPVIEIRAPGVTIENLRSQVPGSATHGIYRCDNDGSTFDGGNLTILNCDFHDANTTGGIYMNSVWYVSLVGNRFVNCDVGIFSYSSYSVPQIVQIWDNTFIGVTTEVQNDVLFAQSGVRRFLHYRNYHTCGIPALGGTNVYIQLNATSTGAVLGNFFGAEGTTDTNFMTLNGCLQGGNYSSDALIVT